MNKISDLKAGDDIITYHFGKVKVKSIRIHDIYMDKVIIERCGIEYPFNDFGIDWQKTKELNNKQMKEFIIECPSGFEVDKEKSTFEKIVFKEIENKLPMSVEEIPNRNWFIGGDGIVYNTNGIGAKDKNQVSTKERAEAFLALMQLVELRDAWNGDWKAEFSNNEIKYLIFRVRNEIMFHHNTPTNCVLHFKSEQLRDQFAEQFKDLIETAKELL